MSDLQFLAGPGSVHLAYRLRSGRGPTVVFLPGYMSDMEGSKALAIDAWAAREGRGMLRLDYSGCGASEGRFEDGTLERWRDDVLHLVDTLIDGPLVLVGSSMGGWLMLLVALARRERVVGLVGIAAAPDFTDWGFSDAEKAVLVKEGRLVEVSEYSDEPYVTTRAFWESGQENLLLGGPVPLACPVRLLHGQADPDVPWETSLRLAEAIEARDVRLVLVKDGDHRLSRDADIALLIGVLSDLVGA